MTWAGPEGSQSTQSPNLRQWRTTTLQRRDRRKQTSHVEADYCIWQLISGPSQTFTFFTCLSWSWTKGLLGKKETPDPVSDQTDRHWSFLGDGFVVMWNQSCHSGRWGMRWTSKHLTEVKIGRGGNRRAHLKTVHTLKNEGCGNSEKWSLSLYTWSF